jgi:hypothetical protein
MATLFDLPEGCSIPLVERERPAFAEAVAEATPVVPHQPPAETSARARITNTERPRQAPATKGILIFVYFACGSTK